MRSGDVKTTGCGSTTSAWKGTRALCNFSLKGTKHRYWIDGYIATHHLTSSSFKDGSLQRYWTLVSAWQSEWGLDRVDERQ